MYSSTRKDGFCIMLIPRKNDFDLWDDLFKDPFLNKPEAKIMKTDIIENENFYSILVDLPGYLKENIKIEVEEGYLTIQASINQENQKEEKDFFVRRERYFGECSRSFYVGKNVTTEEVKASFKNGTLTLTIPKKEKEKELPEKRYVQIED